MHSVYLLSNSTTTPTWCAPAHPLFCLSSCAPAPCGGARSPPPCSCGRCHHHQGRHHRHRRRCPACLGSPRSGGHCMETGEHAHEDMTASCPKADVVPLAASAHNKYGRARKPQKQHCSSAEAASEAMSHSCNGDMTAAHCTGEHTPAWPCPYQFASV